MSLFFKFVYTQVEECFASSERGGGRLGGEVGKKQNNDLILSKETSAFQELKEQRYFNLIHIIHKLKFHQHFQLSYTTDVYILQKSL